MRETRAIRETLGILAVALLVMVLVLSGCGPARPKGEVIVYVAAPLSGFQANGGQTVAGGVRLRAEELNQAGGLLGYRVRVVALDDESDSDVAVEVAQQIAEAVRAGQRVLGVIGHYNSGQTLAAMEIYKDLPIVVITPTASEVSLTQKGYTNFFRVNANDAAQARVDANFLVNTLGVRRVAIVHNDTAYGVGLGDQMRQALAGLGAEVVTTVQVTEGQDRYTAEVDTIRQSGVDAIFYAGYEIECPYLRYALVQTGIDLPFLASDGCFLSATIDESAGTAERMYVSAFAPSPATVVDQKWVKAYQAVEYRNPDTYSINGYTAMHVLAKAVKQANALDAVAIARAMRNLSVNTLMGPIAYDANGDVRNPVVYIFQVQDETFIQVEPQS